MSVIKVASKTGRRTARALCWRRALQLSISIACLLGYAATAQSGSTVPTQTGHDNQLGLTLSPDSNTAFWVAWDGTWGASAESPQHIFTATRTEGVWSKPSPMPFSRPAYSDADPFVSPDGQWLYFVSDRPTSEGGPAGNEDIWRFDVKGGRLLEHLSVNSDATEYSPVLTKSGSLFFASDRKGGTGRGDLYKADAVGTGFGIPQALGSAFNHATGEWNLWVSADETEIVFEASNRATNVAIPGDLYYSWKAGADWTNAIPLPRINTAASELMARLDPDGSNLTFTRAPIGGHAAIESQPWPRLRKESRAKYAPLLLVANRSSHEVTWVDLAQGKVVTRLATGKGPHLLSNVSHGQMAVTGFGEFPEPHLEAVRTRPPFVRIQNSTVTMIDVVQRTVVWEVVLADCPTPHASWIVDDTTFVTCESNSRVVKLDSKTGEPAGALESEQSGSHVLSFEPRSRTLGVSNTMSGSVTLFDLERGGSTVVKLDKGSEGALGINGKLWVANAMAGTISVVNPQAGQVEATVGPICQFPIALGPQASRNVWVACFASSELVSVDSQTFKVSGRIPLADQPLHILVHPDRPMAYVSYPRANAIGEVSLEAGAEVRRIKVGIEPDGLRWAQGSSPL